jgi:hypothetical protein
MVDDIGEAIDFYTSKLRFDLRQRSRNIFELPTAPTS